MLENQRVVFTTIIKQLTKANIAYLVTGSVAVAYYGHLRATNDIDFVIEASKENKKRIAATLGALGESFLAYTNDILSSLNRNEYFNLYHTGSGTKMIFFCSRQTLLVKMEPHGLTSVVPPNALPGRKSCTRRPIHPRVNTRGLLGTGINLNDEKNNLPWIERLHYYP